METATRLDPAAQSFDREDTIAAFADLDLVVMVDGVGIGKASAHGLLDVLVTHLVSWRVEPRREALSVEDHPLPVAMRLVSLQLHEWLTSKVGSRRESGVSLVAAMRSDDGVVIARVGAGCVWKIRDGEATPLLPAHALRHLDYRRVLARWPRFGVANPLAGSPSLGQKEELSIDVHFEPLAPGDLLLVGSDALMAQVDASSLEEAVAGGGSLDARAERLWASCRDTTRVAIALTRWEVPAMPASAAPPTRRMRAAVRQQRGELRSDRASAVPRRDLALFTDREGASDEPQLVSFDDSTTVAGDASWVTIETILGVMDEVLPHDPRVLIQLLATGVWVANLRQRLVTRYTKGLIPCGTVAAVARVSGGVVSVCLGKGSVHRVRGGRLEAMVGGGAQPAADRSAYEVMLRRALDLQGEGEWQVRFERLAPGDLFLVGGGSLVTRLGPDTIADVLTSGEPLRAMADRLHREGDALDAGSFALAGWDDGEPACAHDLPAIEPAPMEVATRLDLGKQREHQEDAVVVDPELGLALVIDAMGAGGIGDMVVDAMHRSLLTFPKVWQGLAWDEQRSWSDHSLPTTIRLVNLTLFDELKALNFRGGGSTVAAVQRAGDGVVIAHAGQDRVYRFRGGALEQLTEDHSLLNEYRKVIPMTPQEIRDFPHRNVITRGLGFSPTVEVDVRFERLAPGDVFLICSDGVTLEIDDETIASVLASTSSLEAAADRLLAAVMAGEARDNIALVLARWS